MPLSTASIDEIFGRMQVRYAAKFERNYAGMNMAAVKADWAEVLDGLGDRAIRYGLVNLPIEWPPNAAEFRAVCNARPDGEGVPQLIEPSAPMPPAVAAKFAEIAAKVPKPDPKQWAWDLKARDEAGESLTITQRAMYHAVTDVELGPELQGTSYAFMDEELPPAMRKREVDPADVARVEQSARELAYRKRERAAA